jgi:hypothetical protein
MANCGVPCPESIDASSVKIANPQLAELVATEGPVIAEMEGCCLDGYLDTRGLLTVGIGHLVKQTAGKYVDSVGVKKVRARCSR